MKAQKTSAKAAENRRNIERKRGKNRHGGKSAKWRQEWHQRWRKSMAAIGESGVAAKIAAKAAAKAAVA